MLVSSFEIRISGFPRFVQVGLSVRGLFVYNRVCEEQCVHS